MRKRLVPIIILLALGLGLWWWSQHHRKSGRPGELTLYGNVDIREVTLGFRVAGRIAEVAVDEGDAVDTGAVLARLDPAPYEREMAEAKARLAGAEARQDLLKAGYRIQEIAQAKAVVREREVTLENAERTFRRLDELLVNAATSQQERDDAAARFREADARLKSSREQLALLESGFRQEEIAESAAELERAKAMLASVQLRLDDTVLKAPSSGTVMTRSREPGAVVSPGEAVLTLSLPEPVWVRAYVSEPSLGKVPPGTPVSIYTDSAPGKAYRGKVGFVSPRAEFTPRNVETPELRTSLVYRLRVVVSEPDALLLQGMPVTVQVEP